MYDSKKIDKKALIAYKKKLIFLNDVFSRFEIDVLEHLKIRKRAIIPGDILIKRLLDEGLVKHEEEIMLHGFGDGEDILGIFSVVLTEIGKRLLDDWAKVDDSLTIDQVVKS
ncbi:MAG: hypothetical protein NT096_09585 [Proteobacteria bacterium]|nr:hypothetical protein [Pseudomonadota bacterium]